MSWQNFFLKQYLRVAVKTKLSGSLTALEARSYLEDAIRKFMPPLPAGLTITPVDKDGMAGEWIEARGAAPDRVLLYFHGGGFAMGSPVSHRGITCALALNTGARVLCLDYRLAPEHPYPAAPDDAVAAYRWLLRQGISADHLALLGDQAGGNLVFTTLIAAREGGDPLPAAGVALSPCVDLTMAGGSVKRNEVRDSVLTVAAMKQAIGNYLGNEDPANPLVSPLFADLRGLPPILLQTSKSEILWDDSTRLLDSLQQAGVEAQLDAWDDVPHLWQLGSFDGPISLPEGRKAVKTIAAFLDQALKR